MKPGTTDPTTNRDYRAGYAMARSQLADEPREVREAVARAWTRQQRSTPMGSHERLALMGGLAYLTERHEGNTQR